MSRRCKSLRPLRRGSRSSHGSKDDSEEESEVLTGMTPQEFQQRKHHKQKLAMFVSKFNKKPKYLLVYASELGLLSKDSTPQDVAKFLFDPPHGLSKEALGEYLSLPPDRHKFCHDVLLAYVQMFDFEKCTLSVFFFFSFALLLSNTNAPTLEHRYVRRCASYFSVRISSSR